LEFQVLLAETFAQIVVRVDLLFAFVLTGFEGQLESRYGFLLFFGHSQYLFINLCKVRVFEPRLNLYGISSKIITEKVTI
jgi:hypothetical protein